MRILTASMAAIASCALPVQAQNLVSNPEFDSGIESWELRAAGVGTIVHVADDGSPEAGSLRLDRADETRGNSTSAWSECIVVDPAVRYDLMGNVKPVLGPATVFLVTFGDDLCVDTLGSAEFLTWDTPDAEWHALEASDFALPGNVGGVRVQLMIGATFPETLAGALFDHIGFGPTGSVPVTLQSYSVD